MSFAAIVMLAAATTPQTTSDAAAAVAHAGASATATASATIVRSESIDFENPLAGVKEDGRTYRVVSKSGSHIYIEFN